VQVGVVGSDPQVGVSGVADQASIITAASDDEHFFNWL
jgi:hypothetical protein